MKVVIAPDSFKGTVDAATAAESIAAGWRARRPGDEIVLRPQADGGEGTLAALAAAIPTARWVDTGAVTGPDGAPVEGRYLLLSDGTACVELAITSGLPLMPAPDALGATTRGVGEVIARALQDGARGILLALGGSASTDGGAGALAALGLRLLDAQGAVIPDGGRGLLSLASVDRSGLVAAPPGGIRLLCDVTAPLLGPRGAAATFGPQKGASAAEIALLEQALKIFADALGAPESVRSLPGAGAAGGTAFGFVAVWGGMIEPGARTVAEITALDDDLRDADVVVTGEGRFDETSLTGKVVGSILAGAHERLRTIVITGQISGGHDVEALSLAELAGDATAAMADPKHWLMVAGAEAARRRP